MLSYMCICVYVFMWVCGAVGFVLVCLYIWISVCRSEHVCKHVFVCVNMYICMYVYWCMHVEGGLEKNRNYYFKLEGKLRVRGMN